MRSYYFLLLMSVMLLGSACGQTPPKPSPLYPSGKANLLLLTNSSFPSGWLADPCTPGCQRAEGAWHAERSFGRIGIPGSVAQDVYSMEDTSTAHNRLTYVARAEFASISLQIPHKPQQDIVYQSSVADEVVIKCGIDKFAVCLAFLRYGNYLVQLRFDMDMGDNDGLPYHDVIPILTQMDAHVVETFGVRPLATPTP